MGRPVEFDQEEVLESVIRLFWERGYEATSMKNICQATGLQPGSLYAAFGNKRALFLTAIDHYFERSIAALRAMLEGPEPPLERIRAMFLYIVGDSCALESRGCMLVNALLETAVDDQELKQHIAGMFDLLEQDLKVVLQEAQARGELALGKTPECVAKLLINNLYGLRVYGKLQPKDTHMRQLVEDLIDSLRAN